MDQPTDGRAGLKTAPARLFLLAAAVALPMPCQAAPPLIIAHRGASHDAPENTLAAFHEAWRQDADGIESDWRLTKDGRLVCIHDADLKRTAGDPRRVSELTFDEIRKFDVGAWKGEQFRGERTPSLAEMLTTVPKGKLAFIELKEGPQIVQPLKRELSAAGIADGQIVVIAFDAGTLAECKRAMPTVRCHWLTDIKRQGGRPTPSPAVVKETMTRCHADGVGFRGDPQLLDYRWDYIRDAGLPGKEWHVWTVNDPYTAEFFSKAGVYSITTDRPGQIRAAFPHWYRNDR